MSLGDPRHFLYRDLDPEAARRLAHKHLSAHDDGELYLQYSASEAFGFFTFGFDQVRHESADRELAVIVESRGEPNRFALRQRTETSIEMVVASVD